MSEKMAMPQNKREDLIFTVLCVAFMCIVMLTYNMILVMGFTWEMVKTTCMLYPLTFAVCFCVDYFIACPVSTGIMKKIGPKIKSPLLGVMVFQFFTVCQIAILESFYGSLVQVGFTSAVWLCWLHHIPLNFIMALPVMLLVCSPLMRLLFRLLIPVGQLK
jgi:hypothetical protein